MLEGKELEGKIGDVGSYSFDVDDKGQMAVDLEVHKDLGFASVKAVVEVKTDIFAVARHITEKTKTTWDDTAEAALEKLLGIEAGTAKAIAAP